ERGLGQQFPRAGTTFPPLMALGAAADPALAREVGRSVGAELRAAGIHVNYVPVADLAVEADNPIVATRAAGDDPEAVAEIVAAVVEGQQSAGVAAAVKHFPGHGRTTVDSHDVLPSVEAGPEEMERSDWVPFRACLEAGAKLVMTAHVAFPALEPDRARRPATFSRALLGGVLRGAWGFQGLVCSDALMMGALAGGGPGAAATQALEAGVDWLLYPPDPPAVHEALTGGLGSGRIDRARCEEAVGRLLDLKRWVFAERPPGPAAGPAALAEALAESALTADPPEPPTGPAWPDRARWVVVLDGGIGRESVVLGDGLQRPAAEAVLFVDTTGSAGDVRRRLEEIREVAAGESVACAVFSPIRAWKGRAGLSELGRLAVEAACGPAREAVLLIFSNPRIVREIRAPSRVVWAYGEDAASQRAALAFLRGALAPTGRLPVRLDAGSPRLDVP
ncbi:MAG TPA: glycoside hydrolase family 3 N-terminal domain-containing protein, partial [Gemmatimonadota bacterium]|nr:glycoside hydrolase family 3 N-terminal domain-containing protein [Gemmatimonadota bacterium]